MSASNSVKPVNSKVDIYAYNGVFSENVELGAKSWSRCGGQADLVFEPDDIDDLSIFLKEYPIDEPLMVLGGMTNTIVRDGGIRGCVVMLGKAFAEIEVKGNRIMAGAGALNKSVAAAAAKAGIVGLEFLSDIPGTVGGALRMNAGAYGTEVKDVLTGAMALDRQGTFLPLLPEDMDMRCCYCGVPEGTVFVGAVFQGKLEGKGAVRARMKEIKSKYQRTQPISGKVSGSIFIDPTAEELRSAKLPEDTKVWQLIEKVGGHDLQIGGARMSDKHLSCLVNTGDATASDLEDLGEELIKRVKEQCGITLKWAIRRLGDRG